MSFELISSITQTYRYVGSNPFVANRDFCNQLKDFAVSSSSTQSRLCFHDTDHSSFHCMLVYHNVNHFVPWHMHPSKAESIHLLSGSADLLFKSSPTSEVTTKNLCSQSSPMAYVPPKLLHRFTINTDIFFIECTSGPFSPGSIVKFPNL
jgi:cupin fold WbuC family metalloprotein